MPLEPADIADVIGEHLDKFRRDMVRELDRQALEGRAALAEIRAEAATLAGQLRERADADTARVAAVLATVRDGAPGADGRDGKDGAPGLDGRDGIDGQDGAPGADGAAGRDGLDGQDGAAGADGRDGLDGAAGKDGADGLHGKDGAAGLDGRDGRDGLDGAGIAEAFVGRDGELVLTYTDGRVKNVGPGFAKDLTADAIRGMVTAAVTDLWKGMWSPGEYRRGDFATYGGSLFVATADVTSRDRPTVSENWGLVVNRGRDGKDAEPRKAPRPAVALEPERP